MKTSTKTTIKSAHNDGEEDPVSQTVVPVFERLFRVETAASTSLKLTPNRMNAVKKMREREAEQRQRCEQQRTAANKFQRDRTPSRCTYQYHHNDNYNNGNKYKSKFKSLDSRHVPFVTRTDEEYEIAVERAIVNWNILLYRGEYADGIAGTGAGTGTGTGTGVTGTNKSDLDSDRDRRYDADFQLGKILVSLEKCRRWRNARNRMNKTIYVGSDGDSYNAADGKGDRHHRDYKNHEDDRNNDHGEDDNNNNNNHDHDHEILDNVLRVIDEQMGIQPHELHFHDMVVPNEVDVEDMDDDFDTDLDDTDMEIDTDGDGHHHQRSRRRNEIDTETRRRRQRRRRRTTFHDRFRTMPWMRHQHSYSNQNRYRDRDASSSQSQSHTHESSTTRSRTSSNFGDKDEQEQPWRYPHSSRRRTNNYYSEQEYRRHRSGRNTNANTIDAENPTNTNTNTNEIPHFHVEKILLRKKYQPTRGWREVSPTALNLIDTLTHFEDGVLEAPLLSCHILSSLFQKDFLPGDEWVVHNARAKNVTRRRKREARKQRQAEIEAQKDKEAGINVEEDTTFISMKDLERKHNQQIQEEQQWQVYRVEKRATWNWNEIQSESVARGDVKFLPQEKEIRVEEYEFYVAG